MSPVLSIFTTSSIARMPTTTRDFGAYLNEVWGVRAAHALYIHDGHWYHQLQRFPGALFDRDGYIKFDTEEAYRSCEFLQIRKQISVPKRISAIPGYVRVTSTERALASEALELERFEAENIEDARRRVVRSIIQRQGQPAFRSRLLKAYDHACCITGFDAIPALEAAHIYPYRGAKTNHPSNGLLFRSDLHSLFDQGLISICGRTLAVLLAPSLARTAYASLAGVRMRLPRKKSDEPSRQALAWHRHEYGL